MLKYPVTIVLILLIGIQTFSKWCLIVEYQVNKDFISKNLCINRAEPLSCCKGKCYLNKKLANDESQQQAPNKGGQKSETSAPFLLQEHIVPQPYRTELRYNHSTRYIDPSTEEYSLSQFQPPQS